MPNTETASFNLNLSSSQQDFEIAYLLFSNGNFSKSLLYFEKCIKQYKENRDFDSYSSCYLYILQILNEMQDIEKLKQYNQEMEELSKKEGLSKQPLIMAYLAYYSLYVEKDLAKTKEELKQALKQAFDQHDQCVQSENLIGQHQARYEIIFCLYIYTIYYYETEDYKNCLEEMESLNILVKDYLEIKEKMEWENATKDNFQDSDKRQELLAQLKRNLPKIQTIKMGISFMAILINIRHLNKYAEAEKLLWNLYEMANKNNQKFFIPNILCYMAWCHAQLKNKKQAIMFFNLAKKSTSPERKLIFNYLKKFEELEKLAEFPETKDHDIIFDTKDNTVIERHKGNIDLKNQFVLIDLLKLFLLTPGVIYSKEQMIEKVWKQEYSPQVHDNKIYVTIKRLREMMEYDSCKPAYICRTSSGYYFSTTARVLIK